MNPQTKINEPFDSIREYCINDQCAKMVIQIIREYAQQQNQGPNFYCWSWDSQHKPCDEQCEGCKKDPLSTQNQGPSEEDDNCKHCEFLQKIFGEEIRDNREYWLWTEMFVYLHGSDECNKSQLTKEPEEKKTFHTSIREKQAENIRCKHPLIIESVFSKTNRCFNCGKDL